MSNDTQAAHRHGEAGGSGERNPPPTAVEVAVPAEDFSVEVRPDRDRVILVCRGDLDHFTADTLREAIAELVVSGWGQIVLDLSQLDFMDLGGVHLLKDARDGVLGVAEYTMIDGNAAVALPLQLTYGHRLLPEPTDVVQRIRML